MKQVLQSVVLGVCLLAASASFADFREDQNDIASVDFLQDNQSVTIKVKTQERNKMCGMSVTHLEVVKPVELARRGRGRAISELRLTFETPPNQYCLMAFGPHRGSITFDKGEELPKLQKGRYKVIVNGGSPTFLNVQ